MVSTWGAGPKKLENPLVAGRIDGRSNPVFNKRAAARLLAFRPIGVLLAASDLDAGAEFFWLLRERPGSDEAVDPE